MAIQYALSRLIPYVIWSVFKLSEPAHFRKHLVLNINKISEKNRCTTNVLRSENLHTGCFVSY